MATCQAVSNSIPCGKEVDPWVEETLVKRQAVPMCLYHAAKYFLNFAIDALIDLEIAHPELRFVEECPARGYLHFAAECLELQED